MSSRLGTTGFSSLGMTQVVAIVVAESSRCAPQTISACRDVASLGMRLGVSTSVKAGEPPSRRGFAGNSLLAKASCMSA